MKTYSKIIFGMMAGGCMAFGPSAFAQSPNDTNDNPSVYYSKDGDVEMSAARKKSRDLVDQFWTAKKSCKTCDGFMLKVAFETDEGGLEHIWVDPTRRRGRTIYGVLQNEPVHVSDLEYLDDVKFTSDDITDWTYVNNGKAEGHFTTKVLFRDMSEEERAHYGEMLGWTRGIDY